MLEVDQKSGSSDHSCPGRTHFVVPSTAGVRFLRLQRSVLLTTNNGLIPQTPPPQKKTKKNKKKKTKQTARWHAISPYSWSRTFWKQEQWTREAPFQGPTNCEQTYASIQTSAPVSWYQQLPRDKSGVSNRYDTPHTPGAYDAAGNSRGMLHVVSWDQGDN